MPKFFKFFRCSSHSKPVRPGAASPTVAVLYRVLRFVRMFRLEASRELELASRRDARERALGKLQLCRELEQFLGQCINWELNQDEWEDEEDV